MILMTIISVAKGVFVTLTLLLLIVYFYFRKQYKYWKSRKVPHAKPIFPFGNIKEVISKSTFVTFKKLYDESKHERYQGIWLMHKPVLMVNDPVLIQEILIKNFHDFLSNGSYFDKDNDPFSDHLFTSQGAKWKNLRTKLTPIFTIGKLKAMFPHLIKCGENLQNRLQDHVKRRDRIVKAKDITHRFSTDAMFSTLFGIEMNLLNDSISTNVIKNITVLEKNWISMFKLFSALYIPEIAKTLKYSIVPKRATDYMLKMLREIIDCKQKRNCKEKSDVLEYLIELLNKECISDVNDLKEESAKLNFNFRALTSNVLSFLVGGFEATTLTFQFAVYELTKNQKIQKKFKQEIQDVLARYNGQLTYEAISEMKYVTQIIEETLRKWPPSPLVVRKCNREFKDPASELIIKKGEFVILSVAGIHHDERYYPEPEKFDPERFSNENKSSIPHCAYLPFGGGPRICIGTRMSYMQIKVGLVSLFSKFDFRIVEKFTSNPLEFEPKSIATNIKDEFMLEILPSESEFI